MKKRLVGSFGMCVALLASTLTFTGSQASAAPAAPKALFTASSSPSIKSGLAEWVVRDSLSNLQTIPFDPICGYIRS